ncbi:MAG: LacI family DNA-binding transcriptional regulator [Anaerolineae bacterium]
MSPGGAVKKEQTTITDVAEKAGVSVGTVSHVINRTRPVSEELSERVLKVAEELDYRPNLVARGLRSKRTSTMGIIVSNLENPYYTEIVRAVQDSAAESDHNVIICNSYEDPEIEADHIVTLRSRQIDGLIIAPTKSDHGLLASLAEQRFPLVVVSRRRPDLGVPTVITNNRAAAHQATRHLIDGGCQRVGLLVHGLGASVAEDQEYGYRAALAEAGRPYKAELVGVGRNTIDGALEAAERLMEQPNPPDSVVCGTALMTLGVLRYLAGRDLRCPEDLGVIGFGNMPWAEVLTPRLTCVTQPTHAIGREASRLLIDQIENRAIRPAPVVTLPCGFRHRGSCGCVSTQLELGS